MTKASVKQIAEAIYQLSQKKTSADLAKSIAGYLIATHQVKNLGRIMREFERLRFERDGRLEIVATSARELSESTKNEIKRLFDASNMTIIDQVDKRLIGGVNIKTKDNWIDLSVRGKLEQLTKKDYQASVKG